MTKNKFKMGRGASGKIIFEESNIAVFAKMVRKELKQIPPGMPRSFNNGPIAELSDGTVLEGMELEKWVLQNAPRVYDVKVLYSDAKGNTTNFGVTEFGSRPEAGQTFMFGSGASARSLLVTTVQGPDANGVTTISVKDRY
ncbi:hypothetical protein [Paraburkholderia tropica]|uniref:hypothetical protein n=1 Tax=Paraburkholderia tropica TaxID=92647 RepID=UPI002ABDAE81|nr:hypothetical protein [Paraburkholderia tropica]